MQEKNDKTSQKCFGARDRVSRVLHFLKLYVSLVGAFSAFGNLNKTVHGKSLNRRLSCMGQRGGTEALQNRHRGLVTQQQGIARDDERLLQRVAAGQHRVAAQCP